jgi:hypothetical protein
MNKIALLLLSLFFSCAKPNYQEQKTEVIRDVLSSCDYLFKTEELCLNFKWIKQPTESQFGEMEVRFTDLADERIFIHPENEFHLYLWMSSMGHGSSPVTIEKLSEGKFLVKDVFFIMPGPWEIHFQLKEGEKVVEELIHSLTI